MNKPSSLDASLAMLNVRSKWKISGNVKIIAILLLFASSILHSGEVEFSGTFQNDQQGTLVFYANGNVDYTFKERLSKKGVEVNTTRGSGSAAIVEEREQTVRGTFQLVELAKARKVWSDMLESNPSDGTFKYMLDNYTEGKGYSRWIVVGFPQSALFFVQNGRTLVDLSGVIYKQSWYSRTNQ